MYKADEHGDYTMGAPKFWQHHSSNYNNGVVFEDNTFDPNSLKKKIHHKLMLIKDSKNTIKNTVKNVKKCKKNKKNCKININSLKKYKKIKKIFNV